MESTFKFQHNILYSCGHQKSQVSDHYFPDHALGIMLSGESFYYTNEGTFILKEGAICLMRRNELFKKMKKEGPNGELPTLISLFLDQETLHRYATKHNISRQPAYKGKMMIDLTGNVFLKGFFDSLLPYVHQPEMLTAALASIKSEEAIELLLKEGFLLQNFLFDFQESYKINLEAFMNQNFQYNIPLTSFAKLSCRSLSTFKRDFSKIFDTTPEKWLQQKRLEKAHFLISQKKMRPSEVYLEVGFENLSHFSTAFKHKFGVNASELSQLSNNF